MVATVFVNQLSPADGAGVPPALTSCSCRRSGRRVGRPCSDGGSPHSCDMTRGCGGNPSAGRPLPPTQASLSVYPTGRLLRFSWVGSGGGTEPAITQVIIGVKVSVIRMHPPCLSVLPLVNNNSN